VQRAERRGEEEKMRRGEKVKSVIITDNELTN
jgi:hypothetical protein